MSKALATQDFLDSEQVALIKRTICPDSTDDELALFIQTAQRLSLDPFARQIFAVKRWSKVANRKVMSIQVAIDGFRLIAERSGDYEGQIGPQWCSSDDDTTWRDVWVSNKPPFAARVGVWRKGFREPLYSVARFDAYKQTTKGGALNSMWSKMGDLMIAKCAEALALRRAFPADLSGVYTPDEMGQADNVIEIDATPKPDPKVIDMEIAPPAAPEIPDEKTVLLKAIKALLVKHTPERKDKADTLSWLFDTRKWKEVETLDAGTLAAGLTELQEKYLGVGEMPDWAADKVIS